MGKTKAQGQSYTKMCRDPENLLHADHIVILKNLCTFRNPRNPPRPTYRLKLLQISKLQLFPPVPEPLTVTFMKLWFKESAAVCMQKP